MFIIEPSIQHDQRKLITACEPTAIANKMFDILKIIGHNNQLRGLTAIIRQDAPYNFNYSFD